MDKSLEGNWALILGASSGFGAAAARALSKAGLNICGVHLDRKAGMALVDELKKDIESAGREHLFFNINAADADKRGSCLEELESKAQGKVKLMLHSLAFGSLKPFIEEDPKDTLTQKQIEMTMDVMANSLVYWAQEVYQKKLFAPTARVYAMTSAGSSRVWKSYGGVSAAKAALESYCRQLALELAPSKVCVNAILAGVTDTAALRKIPGHEEMVAMATKRNPMGRLTTPEDVAGALVTMCSSGFDFVTGNTLRVDGGENIVD